MTALQSTAQDRTDLKLMLRGFMVSRMLRLVADIGVADRISPDGARAASDLAAACQVQEGPLVRVLRTLASVGVFGLSPDGVVRHSAKSLLLRTDAPDSAHYAARFWAGPGSWGAWGRLDVALTGGVSHEAAWGQGRFAYLRDHPDEARAFDEAMAHFPDDRHAAVAAAYDFTSARLIVDVGAATAPCFATSWSTPRRRGAYCSIGWMSWLHWGRTRCWTGASKPLEAASWTWCPRPAPIT